MSFKTRKKGNETSYLLYFVPSIILALGFGLIGGWLLKNLTLDKTNNNLISLRLDGYKFISPLLICDPAEEKSTSLNALKIKISSLITRKVASKDLDTASVYFRDFNSGESTSVNDEERYYPASLNKIPMMIASYKIAETNPNFLSQKVKYDGEDMNISQEIKPKDTVSPQSTTTIDEAINKMIRYSDNNGFYLLTKNLDVNVFKSAYQDLQIPYREDPNSSEDFITAKNFSYFLRVLYNSTYLNKDLSEKALKLLSEVEFKSALAAGVPDNVAVVHKFGIKSNFDSSGKTVSREMHDCGIVYNGGKPYLLCVMTKSSASLESNGNAIKDISSLIYNEVQNNYE